MPKFLRDQLSIGSETIYFKNIFFTYIYMYIQISSLKFLLTFAEQSLWKHFLLITLFKLTSEIPLYYT